MSLFGTLGWGRAKSFFEEVREKHLEGVGEKENWPPQWVRSQEDVLEQRMLKWIPLELPLLTSPWKVLPYPQGYQESGSDNQVVGNSCKNELQF